MAGEVAVRVDSKQIRYVAFAAILLALPNTAIAQDAAPTDFELQAAYCLGARLVLTPAIARALACQKALESPSDCKKDAEQMQEFRADLDRLRAYVAIRIVDNPDPAPYIVAEKRGRLDARMVQQIVDARLADGHPAFCARANDMHDMSTCIDSYLKRTNPAAADAQERIWRCDTVIADLPF